MRDTQITRVSPPPARGTERAPGPVKALPPARPGVGMQPLRATPAMPTPGPWTALEWTDHMHPGAETKVIQIRGPRGEKIADIYAHDSVGAPGVEAARANAALIVAASLSPELARRHVPAEEIPEADRPVLPSQGRML